MESLSAALVPSVPGEHAPTEGPFVLDCVARRRLQGKTAPFVRHGWACPKATLSPRPMQTMLKFVSIVHSRLPCASYSDASLMLLNLTREA
jgi:hypothetical protein